MFHLGKTPHNHPPEAYLIQKLTLIRDIKSMVAIEVNTPVPILVRDMLARQDPTLPPEAIPNPDNLIRTMNRQRQLAREGSQMVVVSNSTFYRVDKSLKPNNVLKSNLTLQNTIKPLIYAADYIRAIFENLVIWDHTIGGAA